MLRSHSFAAVVLIAFSWLSLTQRLCADEPLPDGVKPLHAPGIENLFQLSDRVFSGSQPEGDAAFQALKKLGVTTIITVDGAPPDVAVAKKFGLRYIHLPIGYDGIAPQRQAEFVKAAQATKGNLYVHCHHGQHRGPAAAAIVCQAANHWSAAQAQAWMKAAGTSPSYRGLWQSIHEFKTPSSQALANLPDEFPSSVAPPDMVESMIAIDNRFDGLAKLAKQQAKLTPDLLMARREDAVQLVELVREWLRTTEVEQQPASFRSEAGELLRAVEQLNNTLAAKPDDIASATLIDAVKTVSRRCTSCHEKFRN
jgi:hypothetical protein